MSTSTVDLLTDTASLEKAFEDEMVRCLLSIGTLSDKEIDIISELITVKTFKKGTTLLHEGEIASSYYCTFKGCVRQYYLKDGLEKTTFFYTEDESLSTIIIDSEIPANYYLECVEDCALSVITYEHQKENI